MDGLRFASPWLLLMLFLVPVLAAFIWPQRRGADTPAVAMGTLAAAAGARRTWRVRLEPWLMALRLAAVALLVLALARPQRGEAVAETGGEGIDVVLAFDTSSSMTQSFAGGKTRLEAAKDVLGDFVETRTNDRVGLVVFQGSSITLSPLTTDYAALVQSIDTADALQLRDGTAIGVALGESVNVLRGSNAASRIVILMTDGENNAGEVQPLAAARIAERLGARVYTVGVVSRTGFQSPRSTLNVDEASMRSIAEVTGGTYSRAEDPDALAEVYAKIDELEKSRIEGEEFTRYAEIAPWFLAAAALVVAAELLMRFSAFRRFA